MSTATPALTKKEVDSILDRYSTKNKRNNAANDAKHDTASKEIFRSLEDNTAYFLESIKDRIARYEDNLREVIRLRYPKAMSGEALETPLLRRTHMASKAIAEEDGPTPEQSRIAEAPKITIKLMRERFAATYGDNYSEEDMQAAMEALAKRNGGKRNRDGTLNANPIEEIDPSVPRPGKTLKAASRAPAGGEDGETITIDPNDPAVLRAIIAAMMAAKKEKGEGKGGKKGGKEGGKKGGAGALTSAALAALASAAGAGGGDEGGDMYEPSDASSGIDIADDCEAPEIDFPDHTPLVKGYASLKKECYELNITFQGIHDWITLNVQTADAEEREREIAVGDGIVAQIQDMQEQIGAIYESLGNYLSGRAEAELAINSYPHVTSFAQYLLCADDDAWFEVERSWRELIRASLFVYYLVSNNLESLVSVASPTAGSASIYQ